MFSRYSFRWVQNRYIWLPLLRLTPPPPTEGLPCRGDDLRKILPECQRMAKVLTSVETLPKISTGCVARTNVTDRRQTNGFTTTYKERERSRPLKTVNICRFILKSNNNSCKLTGLTCKLIIICTAEILQMSTDGQGTDWCRNITSVFSR